MNKRKRKYLLKRLKQEFHGIGEHANPAQYLQLQILYLRMQDIITITKDTEEALGALHRFYTEGLGLV